MTLILRNVFFASGFLKTAGGDGAKWSWQPEGNQKPAGPTALLTLMIHTT